MNEEYKHDETNPAMELPEIPATQAAEADPAAQVSDESKPEQPPKRERAGWRVAAAAVALIAVGAAVGSATTVAMSRFVLDRSPIGYLSQEQLPPARLVSDVPLATGNVIPSVYKKSVSSVVKITVRTGRSTVRGGSTGSGFVVDPRGYILTNHHVVNGASRITVEFVDGTKLDGTVVGSDKFKDLAVVKVDVGTRSLIALPMGDSDAVQVGELAIAIGSPFGNDYTVTAGIVSGLNRQIIEEDNPFPIPGAIQTDAAINPGNSGGPLLNAAGEVIGINTAIESPLRGSVGIGFAVPINAAKQILPTLIAGKRVEYPWLGISMQDMTGSLAEQIAASVKEGVLIMEVYRSSPAAAAGLKPLGLNRWGVPVSGDVVTAVDGMALKRSEELSKYLAGKKVGDVITLTVIRGKETLTLQATLAARPDTLSASDE